MISPGSTIDEKITIESVIGSGGMGCVYKASHTGLGKDVAIKVLSLLGTGDDMMLKRFRSEAAVLKTLDHANIVKVYSFGLVDERAPYLVLEYLNGGSLSQLLEEKNSLPMDKCWDLFEQLTAGLAHAHGRGVIHRDIKPGNVMFNDNQAKLVDFGVAKGVTGASSQKITHTGALIATPLYMSPEQMGGQTPGADSDVYSLGCIMFECLYGRRYVDGESFVEIAMNQAAVDPTLPPTQPSGAAVPGGLRALITKALESDRAKRIADAGQLHEWLKRVRAQPDAVPEELKQTAGRARPKLIPLPGQRKRAPVLLLAAISLIFAGGAYSLFIAGSNNANEDAERREVQEILHDAMSQTREADNGDPRWHAGRLAITKAEPYMNDPMIRQQVEEFIRRMAYRRVARHDIADDDALWLLGKAADLPANDEPKRRLRISYLTLLVAGNIYQWGRDQKNNGNYLLNAEDASLRTVAALKANGYRSDFRKESTWGLESAASGLYFATLHHCAMATNARDEAERDAELEKARKVSAANVELLDHLGSELGQLPAADQKMIRNTNYHLTHR